MVLDIQAGLPLEFLSQNIIFACLTHLQYTFTLKINIHVQIMYIYIHILYTYLLIGLYYDYYILQLTFFQGDELSSEPLFAIFI